MFSLPVFVSVGFYVTIFVEQMFFGGVAFWGLCSKGHCWGGGFSGLENGHFFWLAAGVLELAHFL